MDGCDGCHDISSGKKRTRSKIAPHNVACRRRMENAIREADPDRWARYLLRQPEAEQCWATADPRALKAAALRGGSSYSYSSSSSETLQLPSPPSPSPPSAPSPQSWASNLACWVERGRKRKKDEERADHLLNNDFGGRHSTDSWPGCRCGECTAPVTGLGQCRCHRHSVLSIQKTNTATPHHNPYHTPHNKTTHTTQHLNTTHTHILVPSCCYGLRASRSSPPCWSPEERGCRIHSWMPCA